jgi:hypothetical protein
MHKSQPAAHIRANFFMRNQSEMRKSRGPSAEWSNQRAAKTFETSNQKEAILESIQSDRGNIGEHPIRTLQILARQYNLTGQKLSPFVIDMKMIPILEHLDFLQEVRP